MKKGIHPKFYTDAKVICACGNTFITGSTKKVIRTDVCSACHPFFTGEQRIVDTAGQVERFMRKVERAEEIAKARKEREEEKAAEESQTES
ncbi:MAG: 50S ribosomal protein L31 [Chloroflexi bacterium]|nr:MAG: 50S ribosomal protein L31 [Chloroflexota bacterium]HDN80248.1 50S ribosomal protein L31 [Chloroflexota bacterium]